MKRSHGYGQSQVDVLRRHFRSHPGEWISLPKLHEISGSLAVAARVADLRNEGMDIGNRLERTWNDGDCTIKSDYQYLPPQAEKSDLNSLPSLAVAETDPSDHEFANAQS